MRRKLQEKKRGISEGLRRRTHSSSVERSFVEAERRFSCMDVAWYVRSCPSFVLDFVNACEFCSRGNHLG